MNIELDREADVAFALADLVKMSRVVGERFDLVQAGGGNTSVKLPDGRLFVKSSGMALSDVNKDDFCCVQWRPLLDFLDNAVAEVDRAELESQCHNVVKSACEPGPKRPSIETLLHCTLGPFTLHTHPIAVAAVVCRGNWKEQLAKLYSDAYFVEYETPGPALALVLREKLQERGWQPGTPALIFLQNHGMIAAGNTSEEVINLTNDVVEKVGKTFPNELSKYKSVNLLSQLVNAVCGTNWLAYLSDDQYLNDAIVKAQDTLLARAATPDQLVYCGSEGLCLPSNDPADLKGAIENFLKTKRHAPKVVLMPVFNTMRLFLLGKSLRKCREIEDVLKSHVILQTLGDKRELQFLQQEEIAYLMNWEAEKYRQDL